MSTMMGLSLRGQLRSWLGQSHEQLHFQLCAINHTAMLMNFAFSQKNNIFYAEIVSTYLSICRFTSGHPLTQLMRTCCKVIEWH
jgi:hypothetical protein